MSLSVIPTFVMGLLLLTPQADSGAMDRILDPCLQAEERLRQAFALQRNDPRLLDPFVGITHIFQLPLALRSIRSRYGLTLTANRDWDKTHIFPLSPELRLPYGAASTVDTLDTFRANFEIFSSNVLSHIDWSHVVVAGGAVLACLMPPPQGIVDDERLGEYYHETSYARSDIDLFLYGLSETEARLKLLEIYSSVKQAINFEVICVRKKHTITIASQHPYRHIQVVLRLYQSPAEILAGFDVDCACFLYDGNNVYSNPRGIMALSRQSNTVDMSRRSPSYEHRLWKYSKRGFEVRLPRLQRASIRESLYDPYMPAPMPKGLARLLILEHLSHGGQYHNFDRPNFRRLEGNDLAPDWSRAQLSLDSAGATSWYDSGLLRIPYGGRWNAQKIRKLIESMQARLDWLSSFDPRGEDFIVPQYLIGHFHGVCHGTMVQCLEYICPGCPSTLYPQHDYGLGMDNIQGRLRFITDNPGQQLMTGSFRPVDHGSWEEEAYMPTDVLFPFVDSWTIDM